MQITQGMSLTESQSPPQFTSSMVPSSNGAPINSLEPPEAVQIQKKDQYTKGCYIKTVSETSLDQLVIP